MNRSLVSLVSLGMVLAIAVAVVPACTQEGAHEAGHEHSDVVYTCPMHPQVRQDHPGQCPICGMELVALTSSTESATIATSTAASRGDVTVHGASQALAGIVTAFASVGPLVGNVRAPGRVGFDETRVFDVTLRVSGYVARLFIDAEGSPVEKGAPLAWLESPQLLQAQQELLRASASAESASASGGASGGSVGGSAGGTSTAVVAAARQRLVLLGMTEQQLDDVLATKTALDPVPIVAAQGGVVVAKDVVAGQSVSPGQRLARLARLDKVWVEADVFPDDAAQLRAGQPATTRLVGSAGAPLAGKVARILPTQGGDIRASTVKVRIDVDNAGRALVPGAAVLVEIEAKHSDVLLVPRDAVIPTGTRNVVFVAGKDDTFALREVELGEHSVDDVEVRSGLVAGERVVRRSAFLIAAESRLRAPAAWSAPASVAPTSAAPAVAAPTSAATVPPATTSGATR